MILIHLKSDWCFLSTFVGISGRCCKGHTVDNTCLSRNFLQFIGGFFTGLATCSCAKILCKNDLLEAALKIQILRFVSNLYL